MTNIDINMYIDKITIGDSFEILNKFPEGYISAIITDPPYDFDSVTKYDLHKEFSRIVGYPKEDGVIIVFSPPENQWMLPADQYLFWEKPISTKNTSRRYSRFVEMVFVYGVNAWNSGRHWSQYTNVFNDLVDDSKKHPFRKPPSLIRRLILNHTDPGDIILDPFAGSGVVYEVALELGRHCIAIEKESKYYENLLD